jgi:ubiquinone/menaquinone biosynthesis C-methylase UbiE
MNCDGIARWYRLFEYLVFGRALERRRLEYLSEIANASRALVLGDGDGRFTTEFLRRNSKVQVESVDLSAGMLALAKQRIGKVGIDSTRVTFRHGDATTIELLNQYDLMVTHFFLDCFGETELTSLIAKISEHCLPGARWVVSEFALPEVIAWRWLARCFTRFMYLAFRVATGLKVTQLPDYNRALKQNGFRLLKSRRALGGLLVSELWERTIWR